MALNGKKIALVAGARPNFMKVTPLYRELKKRGVHVTLVRAVQHEDAAMSTAFFREFGIKPSVVVRPRGTTKAARRSDMERGLVRAFEKIRPMLVIVVGDVNASLAGARAAHRARIPLAHVEAGLRSFNSKMQEERNRIEIDRLSDYLFATEKSAMQNVRREKLSGKLFLVGNIMMDMIRLYPPKRPRATKPFYFCTLHRAENVDHKKVFKGILDALEVIAHDAPIYLPLHPRTKKQALAFGLAKKLHLVANVIPPLSYRETLGYERDASLVLTDSGGIQEETSFLGTPCLTLREETERPVTVSHGTNTIAGVTKHSILNAYQQHRKKRKRAIPLWDGKTAARIANVLERSL